MFLLCINFYLRYFSNESVVFICVCDLDLRMMRIQVEVRFLQTLESL